MGFGRGEKTNLRAGFFYVLLFFQLSQFLGKDLVDNWNQDSWIWNLDHTCFFNVFTRTTAIFSQVDKDFLGRSWALQEGYGIEAIEKVDLLIWMIIKLYYNL